MDFKLRVRKSSFLRYVRQNDYPGAVCSDHLEYRWANYGCIYSCMTCPHQWSRSVLFRGKEVYVNLKDSVEELRNLSDCILCLSECGDPISAPGLSDVVDFTLRNTNDSVRVHVRSKMPHIDELDRTIEHDMGSRLIFSLQIDPLFSSEDLINSVSSKVSKSQAELRYTVGQILYPFKRPTEFFSIIAKEAVRYNVSRITLVPVRVPGDDTELLQYIDPHITRTSTEAVGPYMYQKTEIRLEWEAKAIKAFAEHGYKGHVAACRETEYVHAQLGFSKACDCI